MTVTTNFTMYAGDTRRIEVTVVEGSLPVDLTGATIRWGLSSDATNSGSVTVLKNIGSGIDLLDGPGGRYLITLSPADTAASVPGKYYHESEVVEADGTVSTVLIGFITIKDVLLP